MQTGSLDTPTEACTGLEAARKLVGQKRMEEAERAFALVLETLPRNIEALSFLAGCALRRNQSERGIALLEQALQVQVDDPEILTKLGIAYEHSNRLNEAQAVLQRALEKAPKNFVARLHLAGVLERTGNDHRALTAYFSAIRMAQSDGHWLSDASTAPWLRGKVRHAMRYVTERRPRLFSQVLEPLRARYGRAALQRVEQSLSIYLGDSTRESGDPRQRPKFLYFPGLPSQPYPKRDDVAWLPELERQTDAIREEAQAVLAAEGSLEPFLKFSSPDDAKHFLRSTLEPPRWDAFFFYRHGTRNDANCHQCPRTIATLDALPLVRIREHAPEICFSVLTPGTHILPHYGVTNTRIVVHLPLIVHGDCALRVGGEVYAWQEGHCVVFDDTYEHEAWNRGPHNRVVLLMDAWNPYLTEAERAALTELVAAIGDFNRESKVEADS